MKNRLTLFSAIFATSLNAHAFFDLSSPELIINIPDRVEQANYTPISIAAKDFNKDRIKQLDVFIDTNPEGLKNPISITFTNPQQAISSSHRVRLTNKNSTITTKITTESGKTKSATSFTNVINPIDFSNVDQITVIYPGDAKRLKTNEIGQTISIINPKKNENSITVIGGTIFHPMLPPIDGEASYYIDSMDISINGSPFAYVSYSPAHSNSMLFLMNINDPDKNYNSVEFKWHDTRSKTYTSTARRK